MLSETIDQIMEDGFLRSMMIYAERAWWSHEDNYKAMLDTDVAKWVKDIIDVYITVDHNSKVDGPKKSKGKARKYNLKAGETFGESLMPERWKRLVYEAREERARKMKELEDRLEDNLPGRKRG